MIKIASEPLLQCSPCSLDPRTAATYRCGDMKALARYQILLPGEQRHIGVSNLPRVVARRCAGRESNIMYLMFDIRLCFLCGLESGHPV